MRHLSHLVVFLILMLGLVANADQLQWNPRGVSELAACEIKQSVRLITYCSLCDDPSADLWLVKGVSIHPTAVDGLFELVIVGLRLLQVPVRLPRVGVMCSLEMGPLAVDDAVWSATPIDFAYAYVATDDGSFRPIGRVLNLPCQVRLETLTLPADVWNRPAASG